MTITRRINLTVAILLVLMIAMGVIALVMALRLGSWSSEYDDTVARAQAAAGVSESASHMFIYGAAAVTAQDRPAGPPPMTATRFDEPTLAKGRIVSWQARGLTRQEAVFRVKIWSRQAWLQAMQVLISSARF